MLVRFIYLGESKFLVMAGIFAKEAEQVGQADLIRR